jgi:hypothetical protein
MTKKVRKGLRRKVKDGEVSELEALAIVRTSGKPINHTFVAWLERRVGKKLEATPLEVEEVANESLNNG